MTWLDIIVCVCLCTGLVKGLYDGLVKRLVSFVSFILAIVFSGMIAGILRNIVNWHIHDAIYYVFAFSFIITVFTLLANVIDKVINFTPMGMINRLAGGLFGVLIWLLSLSFALNILSTFDSKSVVISKEMQEKSVTYAPVKMALPIVSPYIKEFF
ncbi:MAG: CvpA family protein [Dysgonamonadaceae bacterium]|jgi:membrane protein required for colicin V production|nr:CvpA family protein [Dysgonamonadaceae bacterium]